jgi:hypothetical protein
VTERNPSNEDNKPISPTPRQLSAEQWVLLAGLVCFFIFMWIIFFLFIPVLSNRPTSLPAIIQIIATQGFVLPPTWTPGPTEVVIATALPTQVYDGAVPTRIYTPRPTSLPGIPNPIVPPRLSVLDLARIMQGESPGDMEAAYYVGWVAKNRLLHAGYGDTYAIVSHGFFGYKAQLQPSEAFMKLARQVIRSKQDPTQGCLYALSRADITKLGIPPQRADVTKGEWFFFKTWPLAGR